MPRQSSVPHIPLSLGCLTRAGRRWPSRSCRGTVGTTPFPPREVNHSQRMLRKYLHLMMRFLRVCAAQHSRVPPLLSVGVRPFSTAELMARITFRDVVFPAVPSSGATITLAELAAQTEWNVWYEPSCGPLGVFLDRASGGAVTVLGDTVTRSGHSQPQTAPTATLSDIGSLLYSHTPPSAPNAPTFPGTPQKRRHLWDCSRWLCFVKGA